MIVADASAVIEAVATAGGHAVRDRLVQEEVHAPSHVDAEIGQALRRLALSKPHLAAGVGAALHQSARLIDHRHETPGALGQVAWSLRGRVSFYDALYVALAVALDAPLLTADARLTRADLPCRIELVSRDLDQ